MAALPKNAPVTALSLGAGDYARTPSGQLVKIDRQLPDGRFQCQYVGLIGESVTLDGKLLLRLGGMPRNT